MTKAAGGARTIKVEGGGQSAISPPPAALRTHSLASRQPSFLVIGYGSTLHSDDAVGPRIADAVAEWNQPNVAALARTQLTPELAEPIARADAVIFVDAAVKPIKPHNPTRSFGVIRLRPAHDAYELGQHFGDPRSLLALAQLLYGAHPRAWLITVPGANFDLGESLSPQTQRGMDQALSYLRSLTANSLQTGSS